MKKLTKEYSNGQMIITDENEASIDYSQVPEKVQEICRNWFLKCVCIREVLPRIYLELSLVRSARFKNIRVQQSDLMRIAKMIRGVAEPMCAAYTAAYLARIGQAYFPKNKDYLYTLMDFMFKLYDRMVAKGHPSLDLPVYLELFEPTIDWLMQCIAFEAERGVFV